MIRISILYPDTGCFDMDYYLNVHKPKPRKGKLQRNA